MTKSRTPPVWLVLLPALALAAVGVRAVTAEMNASQDAARERARSIASRLARSVDALVEEYAGPLPTAGELLSESAAAAAVAHLEPHGCFAIAPVWTDGAVATGWLPARRTAKYHGFADAKLSRDAIATARRLAASEPRGDVAAAALLAATACAVSEPNSRWALRHAVAGYESAAGDRQAALDALASAWDDREPNLHEFDGTPYPEAALVLAAELLGSTDPPAWILSAYERCARMPFLADDASLDRYERLMGDAVPARLRSLRRLGIDAREVGRAHPRGTISTAALASDGRALELRVWRSVDIAPDMTPEIPSLGRHLLGGAIPSSVVGDRVLGEARALCDEPGVVAVRLSTASGDHPLATSGSDIAARGVVVEAVPLAEPLSMWRAEAVVSPESGVPATAWMLGAALVLTTAALLAGTLALRRAAERSARLAEERQTFLDHVAHELRTPAAAVQALTEELASGHVPPEREALYREHLVRESRRLSSLVEDTLDLTRLDAGRLAFKMEPADLRDVVRRAIEESDEAGRVVARLPDDAVVRPVDASSLRRAVKNLVENAVRHGGGDGPVTVALETSDGHASIVVADRGRGIAPEHLPRLFERFYRVPSATHEGKGVGLGLALCREVARAHGGEIGVTSEVGRGSTFTLKVPLGGDGPHFSLLRGSQESR